MLNISPREYQKSIIETAKNNNTLVVIPTGLGKTLIALGLAVHQLKTHIGSKILFLAPTKPLIEQHLAYFKKHLPELFAEQTMFTGSVNAEKRKKLWQTAEIIFSTPQCIANDLNARLYSLDEVSLVIFDEAHRCLKNYDYTKVVNYYKMQSQNQLILGLTASPGSEAQKVKEICKHLSIDEIEIRTRDSPDVKQYLHEREFRKIDVPFPKELIEASMLLKRIYDSRVLQLREKNLLYGPANKITLLKLQNSLFNRIKSNDYNAFHGVSLTAQAIKISHAIELLETQTLSGTFDYLKGLIKQAEAKQSKAVQSLVKMPEFNAALISLTNLLTQKIEHPKVEELAVLVEEQMKEDPKSKIMVFCQFRDTATVITNRLNKIPEVRSAIFIGQAKKKNVGLSQKEQKAVIDQFRSGELNIICATSIGEEGLDIPEVSAVIFYEPISSAIRKIQRAGRTARLAPGKLIILVTKDTKDEISHYASSAREKKMYKTIESVKQDLKSQNKDKQLTL